MEKVFFAVPFKDFGDEHRFIARRVCTDFRHNAVFGDDVRQPDALIQKLCSAVDECRFGFYDITGFNPNVMIELGIAFSARKKVFLIYDEKRHANSPAVKALKEPVPSDLQGHERFAYSNLHDLERELRQTMRHVLGVGQNSAYELKEKIRKLLRTGSQPIRKIIEELGVPQQDVEDALAAMRFEQRVTVEGRGGGAKWRLVVH